MAPRVDIIGIGDDGLAGLPPAALQLLSEAEVLVGPVRLLQLVPAGAAQRIETGASPDAVADAIAGLGDRRAVLLTGGDPLFYGVARFLCERLGKERFNVVPHVSSMQLAFARVKESWDEAYLANLDSVPLPQALERIRSCAKAGLFTTESVTPAQVAAEMLGRGLDYFFAYVCENLGSPDERVTRGELAQIASWTFSPMNVMVLVRKPGIPDRVISTAHTRSIGHPDACFAQSRPVRGLLTPMEVRVVALALLDLNPCSLVWDVGAGSGSVAIEAARLASQGRVYAIEMETEEFGLILANKERFGVANLEPVLGKAPEIWTDLPQPDAIFVGGTGRHVATISVAAYQRLSPSGRLVVNLNSLDNLTDVQRALTELGAQVTVRLLQLSVSVDQFDSIRMESRTPTFLLNTVRPAE